MELTQKKLKSLKDFLVERGYEKELLKIDNEEVSIEDIITLIEERTKVVKAIFMTTSEVALFLFGSDSRPSLKKVYTMISNGSIHPLSIIGSKKDYFFRRTAIESLVSEVEQEIKLR